MQKSLVIWAVKAIEIASDLETIANSPTLSKAYTPGDRSEALELAKSLNHGVDVIRVAIDLEILARSS